MAVKAWLPAAVGVPDSTPAADKLKPGGNAPDVTVKPYPPALPPLAAIDCEYADGTVPLGSPAGLTVMAAGCVTVAVAASRGRHVGGEMLLAALWIVLAPLKAKTSARNLANLASVLTVGVADGLFLWFARRGGRDDQRVLSLFAAIAFGAGVHDALAA